MGDTPRLEEEEEEDDDTSGTKSRRIRGSYWGIDLKYVSADDGFI